MADTQKKNTLVAIRYVDAQFSFSKKPKSSLPIYYTIGKLSRVYKDHVIVSYSAKNAKVQTGMLIPLSAIIFEKNRKKYQHTYPFPIKKIKKGLPMGIAWKDITHFKNDSVPKGLTEAYTEGKYFSSNKEQIIIQKPTTLLLKKEGVYNHPHTFSSNQEPEFLSIPKNFVTRIDYYEDKF